MAVFFEADSISGPMTNLVLLVKTGLPNLVFAGYCAWRMRNPDVLCRHVAEALVVILTEKAAVRLRTDRKIVMEKISAALLENFRQERALDEEATRLAEEHIKTAPGVDRRKVTQMIKQRLAEEKNFAL